MSDPLRIAVTGASGGIGTAVRAELLNRGHTVVALDLNVDDISGEAHALDVTNHEHVAQVLADIGPLDGLILAHGLTALGPLIETPLDAITRVIDINLTGAIACAKAALPDLLQRDGYLVVLSSVAGFAPLVHRTAYAASKHGLHGFFDSLRAETVDSGMSVTLVAPSFIETGIEDRAAYRVPGEAGGWSTTGAMLTVEDAARLIVDGMLDRKRLVLPTRTSRMAYLVSRLAPARYEQIMRSRLLGS